MRSCLLPLLLALALSVGCAARPPAASSEDAPERLAVNVEDGTLYTALRDASASVLKDGRIAGSGAFIDPDGTFLTAAHVVHDAQHRLELLLPGGRVYPATVLARDLGADIALLQIHSAPPAGETQATTAPAPAAMPTPDAWLPIATTPPPAGAQVYVYGAPAMYRDLMLPGRIAADAPRYNHQGANDCYLHSVNLAGPTPPGISGGCWVNPKGEIIGVQCSHIGSDTATTGMAFIAPLQDIRRLVAARADQPAATLGVQVVSMWSQSYGFTRQFPPGSAGVALHRILDNGPADHAGLPKDVLITHVDGRPTLDVNAFMDAIRVKKPGDTVTLRTVAPNSHTVETYAVQLGELTW